MSAGLPALSWASAPDRSRIQQVVTVKAVKTDDIVAQALQMSRCRGTHVTAAQHPARRAG